MSKPGAVAENLRQIAEFAAQAGRSYEKNPPENPERNRLAGLSQMHSSGHDWHDLFFLL
jgi:hypothetical protein